jgi:hypothetical protein
MKVFGISLVEWGPWHNKWRNQDPFLWWTIQHSRTISWSNKGHQVQLGKLFDGTLILSVGSHTSSLDMSWASCSLTKDSYSWWRHVGNSIFSWKICGAFIFLILRSFFLQKEAWLTAQRVDNLFVCKKQVFHEAVRVAFDSYDYYLCYKKHLICWKLKHMFSKLNETHVCT